MGSDDDFMGNDYDFEHVLSKKLQRDIEDYAEENPPVVTPGRNESFSDNWVERIVEKGVSPEEIAHAPENINHDHIFEVVQRYVSNEIIPEFRNRISDELEELGYDVSSKNYVESVIKDEIMEIIGRESAADLNVEGLLDQTSGTGVSLGIDLWTDARFALKDGGDYSLIEEMFDVLNIDPRSFSDQFDNMKFPEKPDRRGSEVIDPEILAEMIVNCTTNSNELRFLLDLDLQEHAENYEDYENGVKIPAGTNAVLFDRFNGVGGTIRETERDLVIDDPERDIDFELDRNRSTGIQAVYDLSSNVWNGSVEPVDNEESSSGRNGKRQTTSRSQSQKKTRR